MNKTKPLRQTVRAKTTAKLQEKIQDQMIQGWTPKGEPQTDTRTNEVIQSMTKPRSK
ncbi:MAG: DUF1737 domain-containing protein [Clostridiales bacterium]|nr:DUF1737 domain-containing protein [Clostridiales bacterium]